jgi:hypothetical protein
MGVVSNRAGYKLHYFGRYIYVNSIYHNNQKLPKAFIFTPRAGKKNM